jgi:hypothetical protein
VSIRPKIWILMSLCCAASAAGAQQAAPAPAVKSTPQADAGEPRADTSAPGAAAPEPPALAPAPAASSGKGPSSGPSAASRASNARTGPATAGAGQKGPTKVDRLDLGTATVTGDREQPKVMYIVPWKRSDIGDLAGKPMNSLVDEILAPVDRDVFKREVVYYRAVQADASQNGAQPKAAPQGEK